ncbi:hypothetical protein IJ103_02190 [Candidatus Saccharibacteria bacterium]|nr:hypothetical protein [Candidatus Saccharibacteria bacterium]MBQ9017029.1 hypothetical protein [Candidatus Saccharibacteria bacterium]
MELTERSSYFVRMILLDEDSDKDFRKILMLSMDEEIVRTLKLEYCDEAFQPHREYLDSIGDYDADDAVYLPYALYT